MLWRRHRKLRRSSSGVGGPSQEEEFASRSSSRQRRRPCQRSARLAKKVSRRTNSCDHEALPNRQCVKSWLRLDFVLSCGNDSTSATTAPTSKQNTNKTQTSPDLRQGWALHGQLRSVKVKRESHTFAVRGYSGLSQPQTVAHS